MRVRLSTIAALSAAFLSGSALFVTSQHVQTSEARLQSLNEAVASEEETIRVLAAEWSYLNRPERLEQLAQEYLEMQPPQVDQILTSTSSLPAPFMPALPRRKPLFEAKQAVFTAAPVPASSSPIEKSPPSDDSRSFQSLLQQIEKGDH